MSVLPLGGYGSVRPPACVTLARALISSQLCFTPPVTRPARSPTLSGPHNTVVSVHHTPTLLHTTHTFKHPTPDTTHIDIQHTGQTQTRLNWLGRLIVTDGSVLVASIQEVLEHHTRNKADLTFTSSSTTATIYTASH